MIATTQNAVGLTCAELSNENYHADPATGASALECFRESRRLYEGRYITKTIPQMVASPAMELGTLIHCRILEPDRYFASLAEPYPELAPDGKKWLRRKGSDHELWWAEEETKREGKFALEQFEIDRLEAIAASVLAKRWAKPLLRGDGQAEYSIFWTDHETGLPLKCRVDWFRDVVSVDLKTTGDASPAEFVRRCVSLGYHRKKQHYLAGILAYTGEKDSTLLNIAVSTNEPYSAGAYELEDTDRYTNRSLGLMEWRHTLRQLRQCLDANDFSDPWEAAVMRLELPAYAFTQSQYQC